MSIPEIILLIVAIALLVASFLVVGKEQDNTSSDDKTKFTQEEIDRMKLQVKEAIEDAISSGIIEAEDKMSKISNEKIIAVNDYSTQLLDKIEQNNKDVVFLYDMLCQKDEEMKNTFKKMETIRRENKEFLEKLTSLMANKTKHKDSSAKNSSLVQPTDHSMNKSKEVIDADTNKDITKIEDNKLTKNQESDNTKEDESVEESKDSSEVNVSNQKENILNLHDLNMSVLDISKQLGIGQGEVKLVIDLYAKKN